MKKYLFSLVLASLFYSSQAQDGIEAIKKQLDTAKGTARAKVFLKLAKMNIPQNPDDIIKYASQSLSLVRSSGNEKIAAKVYRVMGVAYGILSQSKNSLKYFDSCLVLCEKIKDSLEMGNVLDNIGQVYMNQSDYGKAADYKIRALRVKESSGADLESLCASYVNLGILYSYSLHVKKSNEYSLKALEIARKLKNESNIADICLNLAANNLIMKNLAEANKYANEAEAISLKINNFENLSGVYAVKGNMHLADKQFDLAEMDFKKALKNALLGGNPESVLTQYSNLGSVQTATKKYSESFENLSKALAISNEIGSLKRQSEANYLFYLLFEKQKNFEQALKYYKAHTIVTDSMLNVTTNGNINELIEKYGSDKKDSEILLLNKDKAIKEKEIARSNAEAEKQRAVRNGFIAGFVLIFGIAVLAYRGYKSKQKAHRIITEQKHQVEQQRDLIEEKQKEILDSIHYAKRIQTSLITSEKYIDACLNRLIG